MQSHLPSCWAALYLTAWWLPSPWRFRLASFALFHFSLGLRGWRGPARPARLIHGSDCTAYLAFLWFATRAQVMHLNPSVPCEVIGEGPTPSIPRIPG